MSLSYNEEFENRRQYDELEDVVYDIDAEYGDYREDDYFDPDDDIIEDDDSWLENED